MVSFLLIMSNERRLKKKTKQNKQKKHTQKQSFKDALVKGVLRKSSKSRGEHPYRRVISVKFICRFIFKSHFHMCEFALYFQNTYYKNTSGSMLLNKAIVFADHSA